MPSPASPVSMELPEEIERAIHEFANACLFGMRSADAALINRTTRNAVEALTAAILSRLREAEADAARFRALMRCGRIKPQGSAGVHPGTGERTYPDEPGSVHFGAEFWVQPEETPSNATIWGRFCLRALADDILAYEAAFAAKAAPLPDSDTGGKS